MESMTVTVASVELISTRCETFVGIKDGQEITESIYRLDLRLPNGKAYRHPFYGTQSCRDHLITKIQERGVINLDIWLRLPEKDRSKSCSYINKGMGEEYSHPKY